MTPSEIVLCESLLKSLKSSRVLSHAPSGKALRAITACASPAPDPVFRYQAKAPAKERPKDADGKGHPTVKPLEFMRWLVRLVTPPEGVVLDPFAGSGSTGMACLREGFDCVLIEREAEYVADIERLIAYRTPFGARLRSALRVLVDRQLERLDQVRELLACHGV